MKFLSALMIAIGLLVIGLGGLCTMTASGASTGSLALAVGAPFIGFGLMLVVGGVLLWRQPPPR